AGVPPLDPKTGEPVRDFPQWGASGVVRVYDANTGAERRTVTGLDGPLFASVRDALSPDGKYLARLGGGKGGTGWEPGAAQPGRSRIASAGTPVGGPAAGLPAARRWAGPEVGGTGR